MMFNSIQCLRAVAALMVVIAHYPRVNVALGAAGVDIFFVISGFIMGTVAMKATPKHFLYNRLARIVPLYWGMTLVMCAGDMAGLFSTFTFTLSELWKSLLFIPYSGADNLIAPLLVVGWTLNLEMLFYVVFAIGLWLRAPLVVTLAALGTLALAGQLIAFETPALKLWTSVLLVEFAAGLVLSQLAFSSRNAGLAAIVVSIAGFVLAEGIMGEDEHYRLLSWGVPAFLAVAGCVWLEKAGGWPDRLLSPFQTLGDASYALYLSHGVVISSVHKLISPGMAAGIVSVVAAVMVSILINKLIENPLIEYLKSLYRHRPQRRSGAEMETT